ncbi:MBL fold metallo-hydrolase [Agarivorans sp. MS3-6]
MLNNLILLASSLLLTTATWGASEAPLTLKVYNADSNSFHVNSTLIYGETEAVVVDAGFTKADALRIAANVLDSGKHLTTIFVSQADPDFYFGVETLKQLFPDVKVFATPAVRDAIAKKMAAKLAFWGPKMFNNAPNSPVLPDAYKASSFSVDGYKVEIKADDGILAHRPYLWIPSSKTILGDIGVFGQLHVWTADTQSRQALEAWKRQLKEMQALQPLQVIPGHMKAGTSLEISNISYTLEYLEAFSKAKRDSTDSDALIMKMTTLYPSAGLAVALDIGAKVHMGEMKW